MSFLLDFSSILPLELFIFGRNFKKDGALLCFHVHEG